MARRPGRSVPLGLGGPVGLLLAMLAGEPASSRELAVAPFKELNVSTTYGYITVWQYGEDGAARVALAFHGGVLRPEIMYEWSFVARRLAESGKYRVLIPSFYSNTRVEPSRMHAEAGVKLVKSFMNKLTHDKPFDLLLGKSWGGMLAAQIAAFEPKYVPRLVLVAPGSLSTVSKPIGVRTLLFWARNDKVTPFSGARHARQLLQSEVAFYAPFFGGHTIPHRYADAIVPFATDSEPLPDLGGWKVPKDRGNGYDRGAHPEDWYVDPIVDDGEGTRFFIRVAIGVVICIIVFGSLAFCVFSLRDFWEGKGKYIVRHLPPPEPSVVGAGDITDEDAPKE